MRLRLPIRSKLSLALLGATALTVILALGVALHILTKFSEQESDRRLAEAIRTVRLILDLRQTAALWRAEILAGDDDVRAAILAGDRAALLRLGRRTMQERDLDLVVVTDAAGIVLARAHAPDQYGDDMSALPTIRGALHGVKVATIIRAPIVLLGASGAAPVFDREPPYRLRGTVVAGHALNDAFVKGLKKTIGRDVSLILDNARLYTTLPAPGPVDPALLAASAVPGGGAAVRIRIADQSYRAAYGALQGRDSSTPIGSFEVAESELPAEAIRSQTIRTMGAAVGGGALIILGVALWLASRLTRPLTHLTLAAKAMGGGDLSQRVDVRTGDEIESVGEAFNQMAAEIQERETERKRAEEALAKRTSQLEAVRAVSEEITRELHLPTLLRLIHQRAMELVGTNVGAIHLWDEGTQVLIPQVWHGLGTWFGEVRYKLGDGIAGTVAQRREGMIVNDYRTSPYAYPPVLERTAVTTGLGEPLLYRDRLVGVITLSHVEAGRQFTQDDRDVLALLASQAAIAIENARLYDAAQREITERKQAEEALAKRTSQLEAVRAVTAEITRELDLTTLLGLITRRAAELLGATAGAVSLWDEASQLLVPRAWIGHGEWLGEQRFKLGEHLVGIVAERREGMTVNEYRTWAFAEPMALERSRMRAAVGQPLLYRDQLVGVITLTHEEPGRQFTEDDRAVLAIFAAEAAIAIENARLYEASRRHAATLEQRVQERTAELAAANRELETFTYSVSHDLKAPLRGIDGYSRLLLRDYAERLDEEGRTFLHTIRTAALHMGQLIDDLLDYSRLERRSLRTGRVNPRVLVERLAAERADDLKARNATIRVDIPCESVTADADGLGQALRNVLDNALKFTQDVPAPCIEIGGRETESTCILWVRDNGIGFDMEYHDRIFEMFQRLHRAEDYPGTGIGLAIVRKAMERMGGRAWAEGAPGQGATFYLEVPK